MTTPEYSKDGHLTVNEIDFDSDRIASLIVWEDHTAIDYSEEGIDRYGLDTTYEVICDNFSDKLEVDFYDSQDVCIWSATVGDIRKHIYGGDE